MTHPCLQGNRFGGEEKRGTKKKAWEFVVLGRRQRETYEFENDEEHVVHDKGPLATIAIAGDAEDDGADGTKHLGGVSGDTGYAEDRRQRTRTRVMPQVMSVLDLSNCSASSVTVRETVKKSKASQVCHGFLSVQRSMMRDKQVRWMRVSHPCSESDGKKSPLHAIEHSKQLDGVLDIQHRRLQGWDARGEVAARGHALPWSTAVILCASAIVGVLGWWLSHDGQIVKRMEEEV